MLFLLMQFLLDSQINFVFYSKVVLKCVFVLVINRLVKELGNGLYGILCLFDKLCWFLLWCSDDEIEKIEGGFVVKEIFCLKGEI